jgi:two-component system cell cycle response regulator DivK
MSGRILVVEDNAANRRLLHDLLEHRGHTVLEAETVDQGRAALRDAAVDLIVMDIQLPGGGGERLLREIREEPRLAALPVIAVTALAMQGDRDRFLRAGFDAYISKPIDVRRFGPEIESFLKRGG